MLTWVRALHWWFKGPEMEWVCNGSIGLASMPWSAIAHLAEAITMVRKV